MSDPRLPLGHPFKLCDHSEFWGPHPWCHHREGGPEGVVTCGQPREAHEPADIRLMRAVKEALAPAETCEECGVEWGHSGTCSRAIQNQSPSQAIEVAAREIADRAMGTEAYRKVLVEIIRKHVAPHIKS